MFSKKSGYTKHNPGKPLTAEAHNEQGQSLVEMTVGMVFLALVVLVLFEMTSVFQAYIALLNASREAAFYAAAHPNMPPHGEITCEHACQYQYQGWEFKDFVCLACQEAMASGLDTDYLQVPYPEKPEGSDPQSPIRVTVHFQMINPTHGIILPWLGRMGLLTSFPISASTEVPIRVSSN